MQRWAWAALVGALAWIVWCATGQAAPVASAGTAPKTLPGLAIQSYAASIGSPITEGGLTVFPIHAVSDPRLDDAISLELALERGKAHVRELGAEEGDDQARVGTLVIENSGKDPIVVLAGTVVKGGKQDRQIAQDFVIAAGKTVDVEAFCVEHGRWTAEREGKSTGGSFSASGMIAPTEVRVAAQHEGDQGKVWEKVAKTNESSKKEAASGTLMATYDDAKVVADRRALAKAVGEKLDAATGSPTVLGFAYAVNGQVRGVRWFANKKVFEQHRDKLLQSAAVEAMLAGAPDPKAKPLRARDVRDFIEGVAKTAVTKSKKAPK